jgi:hypothetical protein
VANIIEIILRAQDQSSGTISTVERSMKGLAMQSGELGSTLALLPGIVGAAVAGLGALAAGVFLTSKAFADQVEHLDNLATQTGVTVNQLQVLQRVTQNQGFATETLTSSLRFLNREIAEHNPLLGRLGINAHDAYTALLQLSDAFAGSTDSAAKNKIAMELLGRGGSETIAILEGLRQKVNETGEAMRDGLFTDEQLEQGRKFDAEMDRFATRWESFSNRIKASAAGTANAVIDMVQSVSRAVSGGAGSLFHPGAGAGMGAGVEMLGGGAAGKTTDLAGALGGAGGGSIVEFARRNLDAVTDLWIRADAQLRKGSGEGSPLAALLGLNEAVEVPDNMLRAVEESLRGIRDVSQAVADGMTDFLATALSGTLTWASAMRALTGGLVNYMLNEFNRLAASWLFRIGIGLFTGGGSAALDLAVNNFGGFFGATPTSGRTEGGATPAAVRVTNVHISALDAQTFYQYQRSPLGGGRNASEAMAFGWNY